MPLRRARAWRWWPCNAGGLPEGTFESEIFGHVKGAFTDARTDRIGRFELANNGTLFLDEIANVPMRQQAKLLRVLETGELERVGSSQTRRVDVRILSATNSRLPEEATAGNFREDLLFRINTVEIDPPPSGVLCVEDQPEYMAMLTTMLEGIGYEVIPHATRGRRSIC